MKQIATRFSAVGKFILISISILYATTAVYAQKTDEHKSSVMQRYVKDKKTGKGIGFASLRVEELSQGVMCDANGRYTLSGIRHGKYKIEVSCLNYAAVTKDIEIKNDTSVTFYL